MKLLYITTNFSSLTHTFITREVQELRKNGCDVHLLSLRDIPLVKQSKHPETDLVGMRFFYPISIPALLGSVVSFLSRKPGLFFGALKIALSDPEASAREKAKLVYQMFAATRHADWVIEGEYDHIHAHFASPPTAIALFLHLLTGVSFSFTGHGADLFRDCSALWTKLTHAAGVVAISDYNLKHYRKVQPALRSSEIVHCGIVLPQFPFRQRTEPGKPVRILSVGRFVPKKGFADLIQALKKLDDRGIAWHADIAGDGPLFEEMQVLAHGLNLGDKLVFQGSIHQDEVKALLDQADIFALPSVPCADGDIDGIPVSLMEAMASGCPVVSTAVSGIPELVINEETGILIPHSDPDALADGMEKLASDPGLFADLSRRGRDFIEAEFDIAGCGKKMLRYYRQISSTKS